MSWNLFPKKNAFERLKSDDRKEELYDRQEMIHFRQAHDHYVKARELAVHPVQENQIKTSHFKAVEHTHEFRNHLHAARKEMEFMRNESRRIVRLAEEIENTIKKKRFLPSTIQVPTFLPITQEEAQIIGNAKAIQGDILEAEAMMHSVYNFNLENCVQVDGKVKNPSQGEKLRRLMTDVDNKLLDIKERIDRLWQLHLSVKDDIAQIDRMMTSGQYKSN